MLKLLESIPPELWGVVVTAIITALLGKTQSNEWASANPRLAGLAKLLRSLTIDTLMLRQGVMLLVAGRLPVDAGGQKPPQDPPSRSGTGIGEHIVMTSSKPPPTNVDSIKAFSEALRKGGPCLLVCLALTSCGSSQTAAETAADRRAAAIGAKCVLEIKLACNGDVKNCPASVTDPIEERCDAAIDAEYDQ